MAVPEINLTISEEPDITLTIDAGISSFTELNDTPINYTGQAGKTLQVKGTEDGLEFVLGGGGGEINTASNIGVGGLGLFKQKVGVDLQFKTINTTDNKISLTDDLVNNELDITLNEGNIIHDNLNGSGTNTHAQIDSHIADLTTNPHNVDKTDVGLGNVTDDAQLKVSSNLSDVGNQQTALDNITNVGAATNEYVLTKDTATGNAVFKEVPAGGTITASQVQNVPSGDISAIDVQSALNELDSEKFKKKLGDNISSTGLINLSGSIGINVDPTKVDIPAGTGKIVDNSDPDNPVLTEVSWNASTESITNIGTQIRTVFAKDVSGNTIQLADRPDVDQSRTLFTIGAANHQNMSTIDLVVTFTNSPITNVALSLGDLSKSLGIIPVRGKEPIPAPNGANLKFNISSAEFYTSGENWINEKNSPNIINFAGVSPASFFTTWRNGSGGFNIEPVLATDITPGSYDDGTGGVSLPNGVLGALEFQNILIYFAPVSNVVVLSYGQTKYDSIIGAKLGRDAERLESDINPTITQENFVGYITVRGDATDLSDETQANFGCQQSVDEFYDNITGLGDGIIYDKETEVIETANGVTTTVKLQKNGGGNVKIQLDGQSFMLNDDGVDNVVSLTHGTDTIPTRNYVYAVISGNKSILQSSTTKPTVAGVGLFANVKTYLVQSSTTVQNDGFLSSQEIMDKFASPDQSHIRHINNILRENAQWLSGVDQTFTVTTQPTKDDLFVSLTSGIVRQLHDHTWSVFNNGNDIYVANDQTTPFTKINNLNQISTDTNGISLENNNDYYNLVIWGSQDEDGTDKKLFVNKPQGKYGNAIDAINDINNTSVKSFPDTFKGTGFLIARIVVRHQTANGGTLTIEQINGADFEDLRVTTGGAGGTSITQTSFSDAEFEVFNSTDPTKIVKTDISGVSTGVTRTLTVPNADGELLLTDGTGSSLTAVDSITVNGNNSTFLLGRGNHTGTQLANTISDFQTTVSANSDVTTNTAKVSFTHSLSQTLEGNNNDITEIKTAIFNGEVVDTFASSKTIDFATGSKRVITLTGNSTITFSATGVSTNILRVVQDGVGSHAITFANLKSGLSAPTLLTGANEETYLIVYFDGTSYVVTSLEVN